MPGWDWDAVAGRYEELDGVRWGSFVVVGEWDATTKTLLSSEEGAATADGRTENSVPPASSGAAELVTPCEAPPGGWQVLNAGHVSTEALEAGAAAAQATDGVGVVWIDTDTAPAAGTILNVTTTADVVMTEALVREHWGGPLCVSASTRSVADATAVQQAVMERLGEYGHSFSITGTTDPHVEVSVLFDDGTLQDEFDEAYGVDVVNVRSVMQPVE